jgi:hypothetical protein
MRFAQIVECGKRKAAGFGSPLLLARAEVCIQLSVYTIRRGDKVRPEERRDQ